MRFNYKIFIADIIGFVLLYFLLLAVSPLSAPQPYTKYAGILGLYAACVMVFCAMSGRYTKRLKFLKFRYSTIQYVSASAISYLLVLMLCIYAFQGYSLAVVSTYAIICVCTVIVIQTGYFAYYYASDPEVVQEVAPREPKQVLYAATEADEKTKEAALRRIKLHCSGKAYDYIVGNLPVTSTNTRVISCKNPGIAENLQEYRYDTIIDVFQLNNVRGINKLFSTVNRKLPDNGIFVGCFTPKSYIKKRILEKYPKGINWIVYGFFYFYRRVIPKLFITKRLYYDLTKGRNRILSISEVFGRLYYCGFEVIGEKRIEHRQFFIARRIKNPPAKMKRRYGPIISLNRIGKNGKIFKVYKMRTMYPYSEFLQEYIYKKNNLQEGGKFRHDIRVNTLGRFMRRYWIDELPMIANLLKGDMKLVGVRPLSKQYFNLYSPELQRKRVKYKPGLLPPFYADMPKTLDEIQASEMRYLDMCEEKGVFRTDCVYFGRILKSILFKHAHSN